MQVSVTFSLAVQLAEDWQLKKRLKGVRKGV
jgi:hypothetical protein